MENPKGFLEVKSVKVVVHPRTRLQLPENSYSHNSAHTASTKLSELPSVCSHQFVDPVIPFMGKQILLAMLGLQIYLPFQISWCVYPMSLMGSRTVLDFHFFLICCKDGSKISKLFTCQNRNQKCYPNYVYTSALGTNTSFILQTEQTCRYTASPK